MNTRIIPRKVYFVAGSLILLSSPMIFASPAQAHPVADCIKSMEDHCWTWYEDDPIALNTCITEAVATCSSHSHGGSAPDPTAEDFTIDLNGVASECRTLAEQMIKQRVRQEIHADSQSLLSKGSQNTDLDVPSDLILTWGRSAEPRGRKIVKVTKCINGQCTELDQGKLTITAKGQGDPQAAEVEVCHQTPNPFIDECDVYDCFEDHEGQQSVCDHLYSYNKNCLSDGCS